MNVWIWLTNAFAKVTAWLLYVLLFRTKVYYEDASVQKRNIKGAAIIMSNHKSIYDYALFMFLFPSRILRYQVAEVMMRKKRVGPLLRSLGCIEVDRNSNDFGFVVKSEQVLQKGGVVGVFPESRLPKEGEATPLAFKPSCAYLALRAGVPVIPAYTDGVYFQKNRARVIIGKPIYPRELIDSTLPEKEQIEQLNTLFRNKIIDLENLLNERRTKERANKKTSKKA